MTAIRIYCIVNDDTLVLNVLGTHFERMNKVPTVPRYGKLHALATKHAKHLRDKIDRRQTMISFSAENPAWNPSVGTNRSKNPFINVKWLQKVCSASNEQQDVQWVRRDSQHRLQKPRL